MTRVTELEGVVLGIISSRQPCTTYAVRRVISSSPSSHWSASAGAIYPLLDRLESQGLVASSTDPSDGRGRRLLGLTPAGVGALRSWMLGAESPDIAAGVSDLVRARAFFLGQLDQADQRLFVEGALQALRDFLITAEQDLVEREENDDVLSALAAKGAVYQAEARVAWMLEVAATLGFDVP